MTLNAFIQQCDTLIKAVETEMPAISDEIALNAVALIKNRIVDKKEGINGAQYSTKPMLATREQFVVKSAFKQTKKKKGGLWIKFPNASKAVPVMELPGGYKQFREIQGRQGAVVDASLTGKMWQGVTIVARTRSGTRFSTIIGGSNKEVQDKLMWMTRKYGPILVLIPEEEARLKQLFDTRLQNLINRHLK